MLRPVDTACVTTHGKDPSDALQAHSRCTHLRPDALLGHATDCLGNVSPPPKTECKSGFFVVSPTQVESPTQDVSPTQVVSPTQLSDSASVSPTQLVPSGDERRVEGGSKRSGAFARHDTLPRRKRHRNSPEKLARSWSTSQEF